MKTKSWSLACGIFALTTGSMTVAQGCGGATDATVGGNDDGGSETSTNDGATDAGPSSDAASDAGDPYCTAVIARTTKCGGSTLCAQAYCPQLEGLFNAGGVLAEAQCLSLEACGDPPPPGGDKDYKDCVAAKSPPPGPAARKLIADLCAACAPSIAGCGAGAFEFPTDGGKRGFGTGVLALSDSLLNEIDAKCTMGTDGGDAGIAQCAADFNACAEKVFRARLRPAPAVCGDI